MAEDRGAEPLEESLRIRLFTLLVECRSVEKRISDLFLQNLVKGTSHLALGQEAVAAGMAAAMRADDYAFPTFRGHHHVVARGVPYASILREMMGRAGGLMGAKGGSMHLSDVSRGVMASYAILGAQLPIACGAAWSAQCRGTGQAVVAFFGDGASNLGAFHEALNLATVWKLPVVFVCENNLYGEYTATRNVINVEHPAADRAAAYGLPRILIDGNDPECVYRTGAAALARARGGEGPALIEALTYRLCGHSRADPGAYRPAGELEQWQQRDPLPVYRRRLLESGITEARLRGIEEAVQAAVDRATEEAKAAPRPDPASAFRELWADGGCAWRN